MTTPSRLHTWTPELAAALGLRDDVPIVALLDLARDAAHGVERPAAPITTYLVGLAVGRGMAFTEACRIVAATLPAAPGVTPPAPPQA